MRQKNDIEIQRLIEQLDELAPKEGAVLIDGDPDLETEGELYTANRNGFLRLGIEFLKGAYAEIKPEKYPHDENLTIDHVAIKLDYLLGYDPCMKFARKEGIEKVVHEDSDAESKMSIRDKFGCAFGVLVLLFLVVAIFVGIGELYISLKG